jgi:hypothetical protein
VSRLLGPVLRAGAWRRLAAQRGHGDLMVGAGEYFALSTMLAATVFSGCEQRAPAPKTEQSAPTTSAAPEVATPSPPPPAPPAGESSAPSPAAAALPPSGETFGVAVYSLSRGKGVPEAAREAHDKARAIFRQLQGETRVLDVKETRIGIEGERRTCATFATRADAEAAAERIRSLAADTALFNVVMEPCEKSSDPRPLP